MFGELAAIAAASQLGDQGLECVTLAGCRTRGSTGQLLLQQPSSVGGVLDTVLTKLNS